jgi:UDP-galactopyranose mutase
MSSTFNQTIPTNGREQADVRIPAKQVDNFSDLAGKTKATNGESWVSFADLAQPLPDLVCFSHLRWDFVFQRPQHLLSRFGKQIRVFVIEEPIFDAAEPRMDISSRGDKLWIAVPHLPGGRSGEEIDLMQKQLVDQLLQQQNVRQFIAWYYTPMALSFSGHLKPTVTVYDCMDELSAFAGAPPQLLDREKELFSRADLVFTGGQSLYESKKSRHQAVYAFPSSIEREHFAMAKNEMPQPADQKDIPHPRMGFYGVIDERMDIDLVSEVARMRPDWHIILLGPVVKIDPATLPQLPNLHYPGMKSYKELPSYLSGWDVALLPFAMNESTKFISPTKTPEYLSAGKPVVSTPIRDVVKPYGELSLVHIAATAEEFVKAIEKALIQTSDTKWQADVDQFLSQLSWDKTWAHMTHLICNQLMSKDGKSKSGVQQF